MNTIQVTQGFLLYFLLPLWTAAGATDWLCHRASHIERTSGTKESIIHLLMISEIGAALWPGMLLQINSGIIALMISAYAAHQVTAMWDVRYASSLRRIAPIEQNLHSFLDMIPLMAVSFVIILHWPDFLALIGGGSHPADYSLRPKIGAIPSTRYIGLFVIATFVLVEIPYVEELSRCIRAARARSVERDEVPVRLASSSKSGANIR